MEERTLHFPSEVQSAVIRAGIVDYSLAEGASMIADQNQIHMIYKDSEERRSRPILGVTSLMLQSSGEASFRTVTFGVTEPSYIRQIDGLGQNHLITAGTVQDRVKGIDTINSSKLILQGLAATISFKESQAIGGVVMYPGPERATIAGRLYIAGDFVEAIRQQEESRVGRLGRKLNTMLGRNNLTPKQQESIDRLNVTPKTLVHYIAAASVARLAPGGPVVVEEHLSVEI